MRFNRAAITLASLATILCALLSFGAPARAGGPPVPPIGSPGIHPVAQYSYVDLVVESAATVKSGGLQPILTLPQPLPAATVNSGGTVAKVAGTQSTFLFTLIPGASASATVSCPGYVTAPVTVSNSVAYSTTTQYVYLSLAPAAPPTTFPYAGVSGTVNDTTSTGSSVPVANATVSLKVNGGTAITATTDATGAYTIPVSGNIPSGASLAVSVHGYGYNPGSQTATESGTSSTSGTNYPLGTITMTPNNKAVYSNGGMSYIYGCNYPSWEFADFAPHYRANWPPPAGPDQYNYDFGNTETDTATGQSGSMFSIQDNFIRMGALPKVNGNTPMRTVRWFLFSQASFTLLWKDRFGNPESDPQNGITDPYATVSDQGANAANQSGDPLMAGISQSGLDYTTFQEIGLALKYAAQNNIRILFTFATFYDALPSSGNHRALVTSDTMAKDNAGNYTVSLGSAVEDSYFNNAVIPAMKYITNWENANAGTYANAKNVVFAYDTLNEPDQITLGTLPNGTQMYAQGLPDGTTSDSALSIDEVQAFTKRCVSAIHQYGNGALATADTSKPQAVCLLQGCGVDFYCAHYYGYWNDATHYTDAGLPDQWSKGSLGSGLPAANTLSNTGGPLDKACVIEEMQTSEQSNDTNADGSQHFTAPWVLNQVYALGYAGTLGWGYTESYAGNDEAYGLGFAQADDPLSHWSYFEPFFLAWPGSNAYNPVTDSGVVIGPN